MKALLVIVLSAVPVGVSAEELGRITAFLDGEERVWYTITFPQSGETVPTATLEQKPYQAELLLQAHPIAAFTSKDVLSIDVQFTGQYASGTEPSAVELLYTPNGLAGPLWTSRGAPKPPRLDILELEAWGSVGRLLAVVSGQICRRPSLFSRTDPSDCRTLNGKIETRLETR